MKIMRLMLVALCAMVSMMASAQISEIDKIVNKYKDQDEALYSEKRNPETGEVTKKEVIVQVKGAAEVKALYTAVDNFINTGKGITDVTKTKKMIEVKSINGNKSYSIMVSKNSDELASLIYEERPVSKRKHDSSEGVKAFEKIKEEEMKK